MRGKMEHIYDWGLDKNKANFTALTPLEFIQRTAEVYPHRLAIIHGNLTRTWSETFVRVKKLEG